VTLEYHAEHPLLDGGKSMSWNFKIRIRLTVAIATLLLGLAASTSRAEISARDTQALSSRLRKKSATHDFAEE
jgi:hypothetical protein